MLEKLDTLNRLVAAPLARQAWIIAQVAGTAVAALMSDGALRRCPHGGDRVSAPSTHGAPRRAREALRPRDGTDSRDDPGELSASPEDRDGACALGVSGAALLLSRLSV